MATRDPQLVHVDKMLSNISVGYKNSALVGDSIFKSVRVSKQSDKYYVFDRREHMQVHDATRAPGTRAKQVPPMRFARDTYFAQEHALEGFKPWEEDENADADAPFRGLVDETERITDNLLLEREHLIQEIVRTAANYASGHTVTLVGGDQWDEFTTSDPIGDIKAGKRQVYRGGLLKEANIAVAGWEVMNAIEDHPDFIERIKYSQRGVTTDQIIAQVVGVPTIVRGGAVEDTSNPAEETASLSDLWGKDFWLGYVPPNPGKRIPAFGYEFTWPYKGGQIQPVERWSDHTVKTDYVRVQRRYDLKLVAVDSVSSGKSIAGYLIKNAVS